MAAVIYNGTTASGANFTIDWPYTTSSGAVGYTYPSESKSPSERQQVNSRTGTVQVKAGFLGQVYVNDPSSAAKVILWESSPKKTLAKADKAAKKAQLRAAQRSFE